jgi:hypothetical protein
MRVARHFFCATLLLLWISPVFATVTVTSPTSGSTVASPVEFKASATSSHPVTFMRIYVDNQSVYGIAAASFSTSVSMAAGSHNITVQAWDSSGLIQKNSFTIKVNTVATGPVIPSNALVYSQIEDMTNWQSCDTCAGAGGNGSTNPHWMAQFQTTPSLDGSSAEFFLGGSTPYSDALWWKQLGPQPAVTHFVYDLYFYLKNESAPQALEFDVNQSVNSKKYIFGTECDFTGVRHWRVWDYTLHWQDTGVSCTQIQSANTWHHLVWEFQRTSDGHTHFINVWMDGVSHAVNRYYTPQPISVQELNTAFQMDLNSSATDYNVWVDKMKLSVW